MRLPTDVPGSITISARPRGNDDVEIIFADNGAGMTPDVQRQAFDPFFTTRRNEGGTGLGLHIVYNLVTQQLGGRMMLDSRLGQGTTFRIIMPKAAKGGSTGDSTMQPRKATEPRNGRTGRCPPSDRRFRNRSGSHRPRRKWKIAVIDDDHAVHEGTRFALSDYNLNGQTLEILSAYSAAEGRTLMRAHPDIAAVLLDVIMETDAAGLDLVEYIRNEIRNETVRIILRTGQPGQAPERRVIVQYDINDYKAKTELTADKLFTSLTAALRSYQQLERMVQTRRGLEIIIDAASTLYDFKSMQRLAEGVLTQIASLLNVDCAGILVLRDGGVVSDDFSVLAGSGCYSRFIGAAGSKSLDPDLRAMVEAAFKRRKHEFVDHRSVLYVRTGSGREVVVLLQAERELSETDRSLVEIFGSRLSIAFDNVILYQQLHEANTQLEDRVAQRTRALMQANRRLSAQWLRLQRANGFKNEILGTVAHDLKNPLGVILGRTEMLTELIGAGSSKESVTAQVEHIRDATKRLTLMVDHLISDAMADAFDITIRREPVDIAGAGRRSRRRQPASGRQQAADHHGVGAAEFRHHVRRRPDAGGDRQSHQQRHQIQSDRRQDHRAWSARSRTTPSSASPTKAPACRRKISDGCSAASSGFPPNPPPAKARPVWAFRSSSALSTCMAARSPPTAPAPDRDRPSPSHCPRRTLT